MYSALLTNKLDLYKCQSSRSFPVLSVYPDLCNISVAAISAPDLYSQHVTYWDDVYGFRMSCMKSCVVREASVDVVARDKVVTDACVVKVTLFCFILFLVKCFLPWRGNNPKGISRPAT